MSGQGGSAVDPTPVGAEIEDEARRSAARGEPPVHPTPRQGDQMAQALKEAAISGFIALAMFGPLLGIETYQNMNNQLVFRTRWPLLFAVVAIVAVGRFLLVVFVRPWLRERRRPGLVESRDEALAPH